MDIPEQTRYRQDLFLAFYVPIEHEGKKAIERIFADLCEEIDALIGETSATIKRMDKYGITYEGIMPNPDL